MILCLLKSIRLQLSRKSQLKMLKSSMTQLLIGLVQRKTQELEKERMHQVQTMVRVAKARRKEKKAIRAMKRRKRSC